jgi:rhodanese-related sulfurtransferase
MKNDSIVKGVAALAALAAVAGFTYNGFSPNGLPLVRTEPVKIAVSDSAIFGSSAPGTATGTGAGSSAGDTVSHARGATGAADTAGVDAFRIITLDQMKRAVNEKKGMLFDARTTDEFAAGHIPGAQNLYAMAPETWVENIAEVPRDTLVIIYCSNPHCPFGRTLAEFLGSFGFTNMLLFDGGWDAWSGAGLPTTGTGKGK